MGQKLSVVPEERVPILSPVDKEFENPRRFEIAKELVATEESYVLSLRQIVNHYVVPVRESRVIPLEREREIFSVVEAIFKFHSDFLGQAKMRLADATPPPDLGTPSQPLLFGDLFIGMSDFFKMYIVYVNNFGTAMEAVRECTKKYPAFQTLCDENRLIPEMKRLSLDDLLVQPIQRIPRYILLLTDLVKHSVGAKDYLKLSEALEKMRKIAEEINEAKRRQDEQVLILEIQESFGNTYKKPLLLPHRKFVREGPVNVVGKNKKYQLFLFSDVLMYARIVRGARHSSRGLGKHNLNFKLEFPLDRCHVEANLDNSMPSFTVSQITIPIAPPLPKTSKSSVPNPKSKGKEKLTCDAVNAVTFTVLTIGERDEWMKTIDTTARALRQRQMVHQKMVHRKGEQKKKRKWFFCF